MTEENIPLLGYTIHSAGLEAVELRHDEVCVINTINPHSYVVAKGDPEFSEALHASDILVPDGTGICIAARILEGRRISKIAGNDVFEHCLEKLRAEKGRVFFMGSSEKVLGLIKTRLSKELPEVTGGFYSPPYKSEFDDEDNQKILAAINEFKPDVLFVGLTAPKQEKWVHRHKAGIDAKTIVSIGAVFDYYAGTAPRSGKIWIKLGLEWLPRLCQQPRRLFKRNFVSSPLFLLDVFLAKVGLKRFEPLV